MEKHVCGPIEQWRYVVGLEAVYMVSDHGRVMRLPGTDSRGRRVQGGTLTPRLMVGYQAVTLSNGNERRREYVHRLVALAFLEPDPERPTVNHIDGDRLNNFADNLEWATQKENVRHSVHAGLRKYMKLTPDKVQQIRTRTDLTNTALAKELGVSRKVVYDVRHNRRKYLTDPS
jgi:DNA-binding XRE family transcriptional regulator